MRITLLLTQDLTYPSGLGRYWPLAKELVRLGHEVDIIALHHDFGNLKRRSWQEKGVGIHYVGQMHVRQVGARRWYFNTLDLLRVVAASTWSMTVRAIFAKTDVVHLGKPQPINGVAALVGAKLFRRKPLYLDCDDYEAESNRFSALWQKRTFVLFEDNLPKFTKGLTVNTHFLAERNAALGYPKGRIIYVPNGIDRDRFGHVDPQRVQKLRDSLGLEGKRVVLYVGSLSLANHPVGLLLEAFAIVGQRLQNTVLLLVGGGEDYDLIGNRVKEMGLKDKVVMAGRASPDLVPYYLKLGDVSVDPVYDDVVARARSPLKLFESMALGVPVVTGDVGDRGEVLGQAGLLVAPGDAGSLAEGILTALRDGSQAKAMAEAALEMREQYYWDVRVKDFVQVYSLADDSSLS